ncbi:hypothetical protein I3760_06G054700 [Carya illinoinensis]|nr:hypothetical protein I3760_06G054700 [Carya illinoinensis]
MVKQWPVQSQSLSYKEALMVEQPQEQRTESMALGQVPDRETCPVQWQSCSRQVGGVSDGETLNLLWEAKTQIIDLQKKIEFLLNKELGQANNGPDMGLEEKELRATRPFNLGNKGPVGKGPMRKSNDLASAYGPVTHKTWRIRDLISDPSTSAAQTHAQAEQITTANTITATQTSPASRVELILPYRVEENEEIQPPMVLFPDIDVQTTPIGNMVEVSPHMELHGSVGEHLDLFSEHGSERNKETMEKNEKNQLPRAFPLTDGGQNFSDSMGEDSMDQSNEIITVPESQELNQPITLISVPDSQELNQAITRAGGVETVNTMVEWEGHNQCEGQGDKNPFPLDCLLPNECEMSDWVFNKVKDIQQIVGMECVGYEEQLLALLTAMEVGHSHSKNKGAKKKKGA